MSIKLSNLDALKNKKCLLAFSHGVDSTALFYLLNELGLEFDLAFVNYKTRAASDLEEASAKELCLKFNKKIYIKTAPLDLKNGSNFEKTARDIRHSFFDEICIKFGYNSLIFAHQLNDCLEWFFMQLSKGAGIANLCGFEPLETKMAKFENIKKQISVARPLINISRNEILNFLNERDIKYFTDISNCDIKFKRNYIRTKFSDAFINEFSSGVAKSFEFLRNDKKMLLGEFIYDDGEFFIVKKSENSINLIDKAAKRLGVLMSQKSRLLCQKSDCVMSHKICIASNDTHYFISPLNKQKMDKKFKEECRILKIPPLIRPYLYSHRSLVDLFRPYKLLS